MAALRRLDDAARDAVDALQQLDGRRAAAEEGLTVDAALRLWTGAAPGDVATLLTAAGVLATMPATHGLFRRGVLSWGHVRMLAARVRRFDLAHRAALDHHLEDHADRLAALDSDRVAWVVDEAIDHHQRLATIEARHDRETERANRFVLQGHLDGTSTSYGEWDREATALLAEALHVEADAPQAQACPGDADDPDRVAVTRPRQLGQALLRLITRGRAGAQAPTPPTRFTVVIDLDQLTDRTAGHLQTALRARPARVVRRAIDRLSCDVAIDAVVRDGTDLLAAQRYRPEVSAATRRAVTARDGGCRWPGCTAPVAWCDVHHVTPRAASVSAGLPDGDHHPTNLVLLCRRHHTTVHRRGWRQRLDDDGAYAVHRRGRTWTTLPRTTWQLPSPDRPPDRRPPARRPSSGEPTRRPSGPPPSGPPDLGGGGGDGPPGRSLGGATGPPARTRATAVTDTGRPLPF